jgi:hypothetical protein
MGVILAGVFNYNNYYVPIGRMVARIYSGSTTGGSGEQELPVIEINSDRPQFVNPATRNYRLQVGSPARTVVTQARKAYITVRKSLGLVVPAIAKENAMST